MRTKSLSLLTRIVLSRSTGVAFVILLLLLLTGGTTIPKASAACPENHPNCQTPEPTEVITRTPCTAPLNLTGAWTADDGGLYFIRQDGDTVWWAGMSTESWEGRDDFQWGLRYTNVFQGRIRNGMLVGSWVDVPRGTYHNQGELMLKIGRSPTNCADMGLTRTGGAFGPLRWTYAPSYPLDPGRCTASSPDVICKFNLVRKNGGQSLYEELKPEKDNVVAFGKIIPYKEPGNPPLGMSWSTSYGFTFNNFLNSWIQFNNGGADGDIAFYLKLYRSQDGAWPSPIALDQQPNFWSDGWLYPQGAVQIKNKLDYKGLFLPGGVFYADYYGIVHPEILMYGRPGIACFPGICVATMPDGGLPLLPGWMELGANSVLWNGIPVNGSVQQDPVSRAVTVTGQTLLPNTNVRVTGVLNLDCGHGLTNDCADDDPADEHNVEIHPVYSIDVLQDWTLARPNADLTGVWAATDVGTYYVRQVGNTVWWLGLSRDRGRTFANVFHGSIRYRGADGEPLAKPIIEGEWADVPIGANAYMNSGALRLGGSFCVDPFNLHLPCDVSGPAPQWNALEAGFTSNGTFGGYRWQKLFDR